MPDLADATHREVPRHLPVRCGIPQRTGSRFNTYPDAKAGQRATAVVIALLVVAPAGLLCARLATSLLRDAPGLLQSLVFAGIGLVIGGGVLGLLGRVRALNRAVLAGRRAMQVPCRL